MKRLGRKQANLPYPYCRDISWRVVVVWFGLLGMICCASNLSGKEIDRLLVAVNGAVITEGDLYIARNLNPLVFSGGNIRPVSRGAEVDRLIDLELIRQELRNFSMDYEDASSLDERVNKLRDRLAETGNLAQLMEQLGLQESELSSYLRSQISILDFVDYRFSPFAGVSEPEIEAYYSDTYRPQLREKGLEAPPLAQVSSRIEEILKEGKINEALDQWLLVARRNARIEYFDKDDPAKVEPEHSRERVQTGVTE